MLTPAVLAEGRFTLIDWAVLGGYFALLAVTGWLLSRRQASSSEYFVAKRDMPAWAVAFSVVATAISAATFIGAPDQSYFGDLTFLSAQIGQIIAIFIVAIFFIPAFYRHNVATVYGVIDVAMGPVAKQACSWVFMLGRVFAGGARLYIAALAVSLILFGNTDAPAMVASIAVMTVVGIAYCFTGGIRAVIWTDVIQTIVFVGAAVVAVLVLASRLPIGLGEVMSVLRSSPSPSGGGKLDILSLSTDPGKAYTLFTAMIGMVIFNVAAFGTDHDLAQRMLTCKNAVRGGQSAIAAILMGLPITLLFMALGLLLYVFYTRPDLMGQGAPSYSPGDSRVFLTFILRELPPGMSGLMIAGLLAAALSTLTSGLNAMAAAFVNDVYKIACPGRDEGHYLRVGRGAMIMWGVVVAVFACVCISWQRTNAKIAGQTLIDFALAVMTFAYAGLAAVFVAAIFTRRGNAASAIAALVTGFVLVLLGQPGVIKIWGRLITWTSHTSEATITRSLADVKIAWPWVLTIAFAGALAVCLLGKRRRGGVR